LEKIVAQGKQQAAIISAQLPMSYVVKQDINGIIYDVRRLTVPVNELGVERAIARGLLGRNERGNAWAIVSALFASMFDDYTMEWLSKHGYLRWDQRGQGEAIISAVNALIARH
jgi:hypothetical protein